MGVLSLLLTIVIWGLIFWILWWGLGKIGLPEPFAKVANVVLVVAVVIVVIGLLTGGIHPFPIVNQLGH